MYLICNFNSVTRTKKIQNSLSFHKFGHKPANRDVIKEALKVIELKLYCTFVAADSIVDSISLIRSIVL